MSSKKLFLVTLILLISISFSCNKPTENVATPSPTPATPQVVAIDTKEAEKELNNLYSQIVTEYKEKKNTSLLKAINKETKFKSELKDNSWTSDGEKITTILEDNLKSIQEISEINSKISSIKAGENGTIIIEIESSLVGKYAIPNTPVTADLSSKGKSSVTWIKKDTGWQMVSWQDLGGSMVTDGNESEGGYFLGL